MISYPSEQCSRSQAQATLMIVKMVFNNKIII